jgi:hypothetical protein
MVISAESVNLALVAACRLTRPEGEYRLSLAFNPSRGSSIAGSAELPAPLLIAALGEPTLELPAGEIFGALEV